MDRFQSLMRLGSLLLACLPGAVALHSAAAQSPASAGLENPARCLAALPKSGEAGALDRRSRDCQVLGSATDNVGRPQRRTTSGGRIVEIGGANAKEAPQYNYVVGIAYTVAGEPNICTGTLLSKDVVLTAAHCGCGDPGSYRVTQQLRMDAPGYIPVRGDPILLDELICQRGTILPGYDLALLRLATPARVESGLYRPVPPLLHAMRDELRFGLGLKIVGYGLDNQLKSGVRLETDVPIYSVDCGWLRYLLAGCAPFVEMILADVGAVGGKAADSCKGDSGGPVFLIRAVPDPQSKGNLLLPLLIAVTSRPAPLQHVDESNHCGGGGIYTLIGRTDVLAWLRRNGVGNPPSGDQ